MLGPIQNHHSPDQYNGISCMLPCFLLEVLQFESLHLSISYTFGRMFMSGERQGSVFILYSCTVFPAAFTEVILLSLLCVLSAFVRTAVCKCLGSFPGSLFHSPGLVLWSAVTMPHGSLQFMLSLQRSSTMLLALLVFL